MQIHHQKNLLEYEFPLRLFVDVITEFPHHWHQEFEIVYVVDGKADIGLNNKVYFLKERDILLVGPGEVHSFIPRYAHNRVMILQFGMSIVDSIDSVIGENRITEPFIPWDKNHSLAQVHGKLEEHILKIYSEYQKREEGYRLAIKAGLCSIMVILLRQVPSEKYSAAEKNRRLLKLERLKNVFNYVAQNYQKDISLEQAAEVANFSIYHFTRFFKECTGMTFTKYLNVYRIGKIEQMLKDTDKAITRLALEEGFNSIKTFNRVFKEVKGCSPSEYRKSKI